MGGAILGGWIGASTTAEDGFSLNPKNWGKDWWQGAIVGGIVGAGAGALAATAFGGTAAMSLMSNGAGGTSLGWSITSSSLTTANIQMGFAGLSSGGDLDAMWKAGVTGLVSGALTGGINNFINPRFHNLGFFKGAGIHGTTGGMSSLLDGYLNDKRGKELLWHTLKGAGTSALLGGLQEGLTTRFLEKGSFFTGGQRIGKDGGYILMERVIIERPEFSKLIDNLNRFSGRLDEIPFFSGPRPPFYF